MCREILRCPALPSQGYFDKTVNGEGRTLSRQFWQEPRALWGKANSYCTATVESAGSGSEYDTYSIFEFALECMTSVGWLKNMICFAKSQYRARKTAWGRGFPLPEQHPIPRTNLLAISTWPISVEATFSPQRGGTSLWKPITTTSLRKLHGLRPSFPDAVVQSLQDLLSFCTFINKSHTDKESII